MEAKWQTGLAPDKCTWQLEKKCFLFQKRKYAKLNNVGLFVFECISCTLHLHSRRYFWSGKELWCIHGAWQRENVSLSFRSFCTSCVEKNLLDKFGNTFPLFWSDHLPCLLSHSWFYLFPISHKRASLSRLVNTNCQLTHFTVDFSVWLRSLHGSQEDRVAPRVTFGSSPDTWEPLMASPFNLDLDTTMKRVAEHHVLN